MRIEATMIHQSSGPKALALTRRAARRKRTVTVDNVASTITIWKYRSPTE